MMTLIYHFLRRMSIEKFTYFHLVRTCVLRKTGDIYRRFWAVLRAGSSKAFNNAKKSSESSLSVGLAGGGSVETMWRNEKNHHLYIAFDFDKMQFWQCPGRRGVI